MNTEIIQKNTYLDPLILSRIPDKDTFRSPLILARIPVERTQVKTVDSSKNTGEDNSKE